MDVVAGGGLPPPADHQLQGDPLVALAVGLPQQTEGLRPAGGGGVHTLLSFVTRRHPTVAVSKPRSSPSGDTCDKKEEPLAKLHGELTKGSNSFGLKENPNQHDLHPLQHDGGETTKHEFPPTLPAPLDGRETDNTIFQEELWTVSSDENNIGEDPPQPREKSPTPGNSNSFLMGMAKIWKSPRPTRSSNNQTPWWQSLLASPARRMIDAPDSSTQPRVLLPSLALPTKPAKRKTEPEPTNKATKTPSSCGTFGKKKVRADLPRRISMNNIPKPTLKRAVALAKSKNNVTKAMQGIELDYFANSSKLAKSAKRNAIEKILSAAYKSAFPLSVDKLKVLAGTLRDTGYKSTHTYLAEAKMAHIEGGWEWSHLLDRHFKLCGGQGPAKKAPEVPESEWTRFPLLLGHDYPDTKVRLAPHLFACGVHWMMREIEPANLRAGDVRFDQSNRLVTLTWNESKTDQEGTSISRTLQCLCAGSCDLKCPYAVLEVLTGQACLHGNLEGALSVCSSGERASKAQLVADWKLLFNDSITGHSSRRSGALQYIRKGWSVSQVAFLGRWKSNVILEYAKEALQTIALNSDSSPFGTLTNLINGGKENPDHSAKQSNIDLNSLASKEVVDRLKEELKKFINGTKATSSRLESSVADLESKYNDYTKYLPAWVRSTRHQVVHKNTKVFLCAPAPLWRTVCGWAYYKSDYEFHEAEPQGTRCQKCGISADAERLQLSRRQCLEILAAGFFGVLHRRWSEGTADPGTRDMPGFNFSKLWQYDSERWDTKNFVLMAVLIFFGQASRLSDEILDENLIITRKALGRPELPDSDLGFCHVEMMEDGVSIHSFGGKEHLQADFANSYLGGGVLSGGGTQEECMFTEFPELLASIYVTERMLPHEAVEIQGARRYAEHTMGGRHVAWSEQFCRPTEIGAPIDAVALDAVSFGRKGPHKQYWPDYIQQDIRKCSAALLQPELDKADRRKFVTGLWGCGAFRGEPELKFLIQWISCSMESSIQSMVFCPFDQKQKLIAKGLSRVLEVVGQASVKRVLEILVDARFAKSNDTFAFVLSQLGEEAS
eukprot:s2172_g15.t2